MQKISHIQSGDFFNDFDFLVGSGRCADLFAFAVENREVMRNHLGSGEKHSGLMERIADIFHWLKDDVDALVAYYEQVMMCLFEVREDYVSEINFVIDAPHSGPPRLNYSEKCLKIPKIPENSQKMPKKF